MDRSGKDQCLKFLQGQLKAGISIFRRGGEKEQNTVPKDDRLSLKMATLE